MGSDNYYQAPHLPERLDFKELVPPAGPINSKKINPASVFGGKPPTALTARPPKELLIRNRMLAEEYAQADRQQAVAEGVSVVAVENTVEVAQVAPEAPTLPPQQVLPEAQPQTPNDSQA